ncbi:RIP metalloprotease RseP [Candidatus Ishikawella capsulata]|nr:RIP metalloprotease RseP [Candidatus Ishikawaella capsulata]
MLNLIIIFITFIITFATLITVHEGGHFFAARLCGVQVQSFSIGFGKTIWKYLDKKGTEYIIALIPFGGYVKMLDTRTDDVPVPMLHKTFNSKKIWQKATIFAAGPIANIIFAITVYCIVLFIGIPNFKPVIGDVLTKSLAAEAQIQPNMEVKYIDDVKISDWDEVTRTLLNKTGKKVIIKLSSLNDNNIQIRQINLKTLQFNPHVKYDPLLAIGIIPKHINIENIIVAVEPYTPASKAGLHIGDKIIAIDNKPVSNGQDYLNLLHSYPGRIFVLKVNRQGLILQLKFIPEIYQNKCLIGFSSKVAVLSNTYKIIKYHNPIKLIELSVKKIFQLIELTISALIKILTGQMKITYLSGPISIVENAANAAKHGLISYLMFLSLISINLAIMNMFPLPILDGGHLLFLFIEIIIGKPLSEEIYNISYHISSIVLLLLILLIFYNDLLHILK